MYSEGKKMGLIVRNEQCHCAKFSPQYAEDRAVFSPFFRSEVTIALRQEFVAHIAVIILQRFFQLPA